MKLRKYFLIVFILSLGFLYLSCNPDSSGGGSGGSSCVDNDSDNRGANCSRGSDCDDSDPDNWESCDSCKDKDKDLRFLNCDRYRTIRGPDCDDTDIYNWNSCANCTDSDGDTYRGTDCDLNNEDICDSDDRNWTAAGCANCVDSDGDSYRGTACDSNEDECDDDEFNWTSNGCLNCADADGDGRAINCDAGEDDQCEGDGYNWTASGCANCTDSDGDTYRGTACDSNEDECDSDDKNWTASGCANCTDSDGDTYRGTSCDSNEDECESDDRNWTASGCANCTDADGDTYRGTSCDSNEDECDDDEYNWTSFGCLNCTDTDGDGRALNCDAGEDDQCEGDGYNWTASGCADCQDGDTDGYYADCDSYDAGQAGPDCDDGDTSIYPGATEICDDSIDQDCDGSVQCYEWTWMSGDTVTNQNGVYGTKGTPDPANVPGSRTKSVSWTDSSGNLWLFGGYGYPASGAWEYLNDLWRWDGTNWTWMSGSDVINQNGVYGTKGTPDPANFPGSRENAVSWTDSSGNFWLFGGSGYAASGGAGLLNDLWKWDGTNWTWMSGTDLRWQCGVYGIKGTPAPANVPGPRVEAVSWIDSSGNLWLFGGFGRDASSYDYLNDLWRWDGTNWTWMSGSDVINQNGVYGTKGTPDPANVPGARRRPVSWKDPSGNMWLFGGWGYPASGDEDRLNDLWRWDGNNWTWMSGSDVINQHGVYGTKGTPDPANVPGGRSSAVSWTDSSGNFWLFGGWGCPASGSRGSLNDLWKWDGTNWTWMSGSNLINQYSFYGTRGTPDPANVPGTRSSAVSWIDAQGKLWLFGGTGRAESSSGYLNDLWRY